MRCRHQRLRVESCVLRYERAHAGLLPPVAVPDIRHARHPPWNHRKGKGVHKGANRHHCLEAKGARRWYITVALVIKTKNRIQWWDAVIKILCRCNYRWGRSPRPRHSWYCCGLTLRTCGEYTSSLRTVLSTRWRFSALIWNRYDSQLFVSQEKHFSVFSLRQHYAYILCLGWRDNRITLHSQAGRWSVVRSGGRLRAKEEFRVSRLVEEAIYAFLWAICLPFLWRNDRNVTRAWLLSNRSFPVHDCCTAHVGPAVCLVVMTYAGCDATTAIIMLILALAFNGAACQTSLQNHQDLAPNYAGSLYGIMNTFGSFPGFIIPPIIGALTNERVRLS